MSCCGLRAVTEGDDMRKKQVPERNVEDIVYRILEHCADVLRIVVKEVRREIDDKKKKTRREKFGF